MVLWPGAGPNPASRFVPRHVGLGEPPAVQLEHPIDGFEVASGQWRVDIDESRTVKLTGERSLWFKSTANTALIQHGAAHQAPVQAGRRYKAHVVFQADDITGGKTVAAYLEWMGADKTTVISTDVIYEDEATELNTWQRAEVTKVAPATAFYSRLRFGRTGTSFNCYYDEADMVSAIPSWDVYLPSDQLNIANGASERVEYISGESLDCTFDTSAGNEGKITIVVPGKYFIRAGVTWATMSDGGHVRMALYLNGSFSEWLWEWSAGATGTHRMLGTVMADLVAGDIVHIVVQNNSGAARDLDSASDFSGVRIM